MLYQQKIEAIIFDLDGTIVDTEILWAKAMLEYLRRRDCDCDQEEMLQLVYGRSWLDIFDDLRREYPAIDAVSADEMARELSIYHKEFCAVEENFVIESSAELLKKLARDYPVIVVSGSPRADVLHNLEVAGVADCVRFVLGAEDYPSGKPSPSGFLKGAEMLGVPPAACLVFEDSWAGVSAAKSAGMKCVALSRDNAHNQDVQHADLILSDLAHFDLAAFNAAIQDR